MTDHTFNDAQGSGWFHSDEFMLDTLNAVRVMMKNRDRSEGEELIYSAVRQCVETLESRLAAQPPAAPVETDDPVSLSDRLRKLAAREDELSHDCDMRPEDTANYEFAQWLREAASFIERAQAHQSCSAETGEATEPVAWTNEAQLGFLKQPAYAQIPMAMWANRGNSADIALYTSRPVVAAEPEVEQRIAVLSDALKSISKNTCCDNCQEAARVARAALGAYVGLARSEALQALADIDRDLIGHDETIANLNALKVRK